MAGPSVMTLIRNGAKFVPCMKSTQEDFLHYQVTCPSIPSFTNETCTYEEYLWYACNVKNLKGFPYQSYRFIIPMFLHAGIIHLLTNLMSQLYIGIPLERKFGLIRIAIIYILSGIGGTLLSAIGLPRTAKYRVKIKDFFTFSVSTGASGAIKRTNTRMATSTAINYRLLESIRDEPKRMLVPISGYEKVTVKSLEDACEPIKDLLDYQLKDYTTVAKMNSLDPPDKLTQDESASIHLYTMEWEEHDNSLYIKLNQTLRLADRLKLKPWFKYLKLFLTAFFKLPPSKDTLVWRGVREDLSALYPKGKEFAWWAFSSCSTSIDVLESPNYLGKSGTRTIFSIQTNSGKLIRAHSYFDNEDEILLPPGIYLKVVGSLNSGNGLHIIHLQEIEPPYKMLADPFDLSELKHALPPAKPPSYMIYPQKEEEYSSPTSVLSKPSVEPSFKKGKFIVFS
ncbi:unnamed protein product [Adineta steineri]|uniref:NAD(P)(+)--arginine ADP-ribosyltransferase n=1 Tax=Adineta steineri TaxID=433720 RepID=A0A813YVN7_9BILA|nr:unnamed protein product [Adineta steineri]CAF0889713.1 unnamed protein product [Adineta steineri]CAF4019786.1 unnamed protein product [Adineta steineri]